MLDAPDLYLLILMVAHRDLISRSLYVIGDLFKPGLLTFANYIKGIAQIEG